ncbi:MAG: glycosyl hydrolase family 18 protein [Cytophagaceae bacterium]
MKRNFTTIAIFLFLIFLSITDLSAQKVIGYFPSYRGSVVNQLPACLTDIQFAFINCNSSGNLYTTLSTGGDPSNVFGFDAAVFANVKAKCKPAVSTGPNLWISVGGADNGNLRRARLSSVCANATYRNNLVTDLVNFAITHNLYGIDFDWEFPVTTADKNNHQQLLAELRTRINSSTRPDLKISIAVGGEYKFTVNHLQYINQGAIQYCDFVHVMTYDFPSSYNADHSTLNDTQLSMQAWAGTNSYGISVPWSKLVLGIPYYAWDATRSGTREYMNDANYQTAYNTGLAAGYYYNSKATMDAKVDWIMAQGGAGVFMWDLGEDRYGGSWSYTAAICTRMASACPAPTPNLGPDVGLCTPGSITLNSNVATQTGRTFTWRRNGTVITGATSPTYSATQGGTYQVTVTQGSCSRNDDIVVTESSAATATGASRCGPGQLTLNITSGSGTYEWYDQANGGTLLQSSTSLSYTTPSISTTTTYYLQRSTGSVNYNTGKATINAPSAWNELADNGSNAAVYGHKITVTQTMSINNVVIYTNGSARNNARVVAYSSIDGTTPLATGTISNIPAMAAGTPYTLPVNMTLTPGTYFIGLYVPGVITGNAAIWLEPNYTSTAPFTITGVCSIEAKCYANYGGGFTATQTPTHYGQLFNWSVSTGTPSPCSRTPVVATINTAANPALSVTSVSPICTGVNGTVTVQASEPGVSYRAYIGGTAVGTAVNGTGGNINISIPSANLSVGSNTITIEATKTGCGAENLSTQPVITVNSTPAQPSNIVGSATVCAGTNGTYSVTSVTGVNYTWSYTGTGVTFTGSGNSVTATFASNATAGNITVTPSNTCGPGTARTLAVTINNVPAQPSNITGSATVCAGTSGTYSVTSVTGVNYTWSYTGTGVTFTGTGNSVTANFAANATAGDITVTPENNCGTGTARTLPVSITTVPNQPTNITGSATVCAGTSGTYSVTAVTGVTYAWSYTGTGVTFTGTGNSVTATFASNATAGNITVIPSNNCGPGTARTLAVTINNVPAQPTNITGSATVCAGTSGTYSVTAVTGVTYAWSYTGTGVTFTGTGNSVTATFASNATAGNITVTPSNNCGPGTARTLAVTINNVPAQPSNITGSATVCAGTSGTYSVTAVTGVTYAWSYTGIGVTFTGSGNSVTATFASNATAGNITVTPSNTCGPGTARTLAVTINNVPAQPSNITGTATVCAGTSGTYSVTAVTGVTYAWSYSGTGVTFTGTGNSVTANFASNATAGNITVTPSNNCGPGTARTLAVTINTVPSQPSNVTGSATVCAGTSGTYSITQVTGVTYAWSYTGTGVTFTGSGNSVTAAFASNATAGNITVTPSNTCGTGTARTLAVTINSAPAQPSTITGSATVCAGTSGTYSVTAVTGVTYAWSYTGTGVTFTGTGNSVTANFASNATAGNITVTPSNSCGAGTARTLGVTVNPLPGTASAINGPNSVCANSTGNIYSIPNVANATGYNWTLPSGAIITAGANTRSITVSFGTAGGTIAVTPINACGSGSGSTVTVSVSSNSPASVSIQASNNSSCNGSQISFTATPENGGGSPSYQWQVNGTNTGSNSSVFNSSTLVNGDLVRVIMTSSISCVTGSPATSNVITVNRIPNGTSPCTAPDVSSISGPASVNVNQSGVSYSVPNTAGATYVWSVPEGATIVSGQGTNSIVVDFGTSGGEVSVQANNEFGNSQSSITIVINNPTNVNSTNGILSVNLYPNPSESTSILEVISPTTERMVIKIYQINSNEIQQEIFIETNERLSIGDGLNAGVYIVEINSGSTRRLVKWVKM